MKRILSFLLCAAAILSCKPTPKEGRPNIIYIMVDDMGYADLSCYGRKDYQTPALDAFAKESKMFTQAYAAAPVCTPSRVAFMTGRYPARNPIGLREPLLMDSTDINMGLSPQLPTVSSLLRKSGYATALFGKWHLGFNPEFFPSAHGFDTFFGITPGGADYVSHRYEGKQALYENNSPVEKEGYLTDLITERALEYIKKTKGPYFISLQYNAPHWPWQAPGDPAYPDAAKMSSGGSAEIYAGMVTNLDQNIGRVLEATKNSNTLVIFTSDNGGERYSDMGPFKGKKMQLWEGGIRVPALVRWPGNIPGGTSTDQVAVTMDWTVTILNAADVRVEKEMGLDGINLIPVLFEENKTFDRKLYWRLTNREPWGAFRDGDWKYITHPQGEGLYNLREDIGETSDQKEAHPDIFQNLKKEYENVNSEMLPPYVFPKKK